MERRTDKTWIGKKLEADEHGRSTIDLVEFGGHGRVVVGRGMMMKNSDTRTAAEAQCFPIVMSHHSRKFAVQGLGNSLLKRMVCVRRTVDLWRGKSLDELGFLRTGNTRKRDSKRRHWQQERMQRKIECARFPCSMAAARNVTRG